MELGNNVKAFSFENYGAHSRCAMIQNQAEEMDAACLRMQCNATQVVVKIEDKVYNCPPEGGFITIGPASFQGKLECPSYEEMCEESLDHRCSFDCSGSGYCMADRTCQCLHGFLGVDCNYYGKKETD